MSKVCLTTFIYGKKYQAYIPFLVYSCNKAYPEYDIILFLYEKLDPQIKRSVARLKLANNVKILEEQFTECENMTPLKSQSLRWVLWHDDFMKYDYLYTVDIDVLYIKEPIDLHIQHIEHMKILDLPLSNIRRKSRYNPFSIKSLYHRVNEVGLSYIFEFFRQGNKNLDRLSGLHFVSIPEYYSALTPEVREKFKNDIFTGKFSNYIMLNNDEALLAYIVKDIGFDLTKLGIRNDPVKMLDFNNYKSKEFRPIHGIHLGIFRREKTKSFSRTANSEVYKYYFKRYKEEILEDKMFLKLLKNAPEHIRNSFELLHEFTDEKRI